jgi:hypothetical protein
MGPRHSAGSIEPSISCRCQKLSSTLYLKPRDVAYPVSQEAIMKFTAAIAMGLALAVSVKATGKVRVCVSSSTYVSLFDLAKAEAIALRMFATAGVTLEWRDAGSAACRNSDQARTVVLDFHSHTAPIEHPGALAFALPYQGSRIVVLFDRIASSAVGPRQVSAVLAHVMAHEITHLLEGVARHSKTGVMKAYWDRHDLSQMWCKPLPFDAEDIYLIQHALGVIAVGATPGIPASTPATTVE